MFVILQQIFNTTRGPSAAQTTASPAIPDYLADLLDRAAVEKQHLTWEALRQYADAYELPLELLVARVWKVRFPFVELLTAGVPQSDLARYERDWTQLSPTEQTRRLADAFAYAAGKRQRHLLHQG